MEMTAWMAGEQHSAEPESVSTTIADFIRVWNDGLQSDKEREILRPILPSLLNSRGTPDTESTRAGLCVDWLVNIQAPSWLRMIHGMKGHAEAVQNSNWRDASIYDICGSVLKYLHNAGIGASVSEKVYTEARAALKKSGASAAYTAGMNAGQTFQATNMVWRVIDNASLGAIATYVQITETIHGRTLWPQEIDSALDCGIVKQLQSSALDLVDRMLQV